MEAFAGIMVRRGARMNSAIMNLIEAIATIGGIPAEGAELVAEAYLREKVVKLDGITGGYTVVHGIFFDKETIKSVYKMKKGVR